MSPQLAELEADALKLSKEERALLADHLLASLGASTDVEQAWSLEVERRLIEVEAGRVELTPLSQALSQARNAVA